LVGDLKYILFIYLYTYATSISVPSFDQDICGRGFPTAVQSKITIDPSKAIVERGIATNSGDFNLLIVSTRRKNTI